MAYDKRGKKLERHDIAKIANQINSLELHGLTKNEIKVFWAVLSQMANQSDNKIIENGIHFSYNEIAQLADLKHLSKRRLSNTIGKMFEDLTQAKFIEKTDVPGKYRERIVVPITNVDISEEDEDIWVLANKTLIPFLRNLKATYTSFVLANLMTLNSRYSQRLYTLIMQWKTTGKFSYERDLFYKLMDVPKSYRRSGQRSTIDVRIINPAIKELNEKGLTQNLRCKKEYVSSGEVGRATLSKYTFTFKPQKIQLSDKDTPNTSNGKFRKIKPKNVKSADKKKQEDKNDNFNREKKNHKSTVKNHTFSGSMIDSAFGNLFD